MVAERIEEKVGEQYHMLRCRGLGGGPLASVLLLAIRKSLTRGVLRECWRRGNGGGIVGTEMVCGT